MNEFIPISIVFGSLIIAFVMTKITAIRKKKIIDRKIKEMERNENVKTMLKARGLWK